MKNLSIEHTVAAEPAQRSAFDFRSPDLRNFDESGCIDWPSSTMALRQFLAALGVSQPGTVARSLVEEFGTLSDLLSASKWRLRGVVGRRLARTIWTSNTLMKAMLKEKIVEGPLIQRSQELVDFLQAEVGFLKHERLLALYVNSQGRLMRIERIADGQFGGIEVNFRSIICCALAIGAAGLILVHNHPSGIPEPSKADLAQTERLKRLSEQLDITLLDHLIVARGRLGTIGDYWREAQWRGNQIPHASDLTNSSI